MNDKTADLAEIIFNFLSKLPETIRSNILVFVLIYGFDLIPSQDSNLLGQLRQSLLEPIGPHRFAAVIRSVGATDHVLARFVATEHNNVHSQPIFEQRLAAYPKLMRIFQVMKLGRPLRIRHAEAALHTWKALRDNELSPRMMMDFEDMCLRSPNLKLPTNQ